MPPTMYINNSYPLVFQTVNIKWPIDIDDVNGINHSSNERQRGLWHVSSTP